MKESPTDFLVRSLEEIENAEDCVLVFRKIVDGKDVIDWVANEVPAWKAVGMLAWAQFDMQYGSDEEEDS